MEKLLALLTTGTISIASFFGFVPDTQVADLLDEINELNIKVHNLELQSEDINVGATKPAGLFPYYLGGGGISSSATSFTLTSFTLPQSDYPIQDSDLSDTFYLTLEPGSTDRQEFVSCTTVGTNTGGSVTISGCTRGLLPISPYTASTSLQFSHSGGSIVILSDSPQLFEEYGALANDEAITGNWTAPTPTGTTSVATRGFVLNNVTTGDIKTDGVVMTAPAGETVATGTIVYFDTTQKEWMKADADITASSTNVQLGIAQGAGTNGNNIANGVLTKGYDTTQTSMTAGNTIYLSNTTGATSTSAGTYSVILGQARTATVLYFDPIYANSAGLGFDNTFSGQNTFSATNTFSSGVTGSIESPDKMFTASSTFTGASTPQAVHFSTSSTAYLADGNDTDRMRFGGFAITSVSAGANVKVRTSGIVTGFTGLTAGEEYYLSDTAGEISTTTGTYEVFVGVAVSSTELLIQKGKRYASGTFTADAVESNIQTVGFRVSRVKITAYYAISSEIAVSTGGWTTFGGNRNVHSHYNEGTAGIDVADASNAFNVDGSGGGNTRGSVSSITDVSFDINVAEADLTSVVVYWEAEGEL